MVLNAATGDRRGSGAAAAQVVLDDRSRLPGRFFGRFTTTQQLRS